MAFVSKMCLATCSKFNNVQTLPIACRDAAVFRSSCRDPTLAFASAPAVAAASALAMASARAFSIA